LAESKGATAPWWPALAIAGCALVFTVASFWWLNARRGRLRSYEPHTFAAAYSEALLTIKLPLVLHNTGAAPIVVQDLRLSFPAERTSVLPIPWNATRTQLRPVSDDPAVLPAVFAVAGRSTQQMFIEFRAPLPGIHLQAKDYAGRIEVELGHKNGWRPLLDFTLRAGNILSPGRYLAYSNSPRNLTDEDRAKVAAVLTSMYESATRTDEAAPLGD
jgi:hypothetical protein